MLEEAEEGEGVWEVRGEVGEEGVVGGGVVVGWGSGGHGWWVGGRREGGRWVGDGEGYMSGK